MSEDGWAIVLLVVLILGALGFRWYTSSGNDDDDGKRVDRSIQYEVEKIEKDLERLETEVEGIQFNGE